MLLKRMPLHFLKPNNVGIAGEHHHGGSGMMLPEPTQLFVENHLMKLLAQSPDGTLMCCANDTQLKFVDSRYRIECILLFR